MKKETRKDEAVELACELSRLLAGKKMSVVLHALTRLYNAILQAGWEEFTQSTYPKGSKRNPSSS